MDRNLMKETRVSFIHRKMSKIKVGTVLCRFYSFFPCKLWHSQQTYKVKRTSFDLTFGIQRLYVTCLRHILWGQWSQYLNQFILFQTLWSFHHLPLSFRIDCWTDTHSIRLSHVSKRTQPTESGNPWSKANLLLLLQASSHWCRYCTCSSRLPAGGLCPCCSSVTHNTLRYWIENGCSFTT